MIITSRAESPEGGAILPDILFRRANTDANNRSTANPVFRKPRTMKCPSCGANTPVDAMVCAYCDTLLVSPESTSRAAMFQRIRQSREYLGRERAERVDSLPKVGILGKVFVPAFFGVFALVAGMMFVTMVGMSGLVMGSGFGGGFSLIPLFMAVVPLSFIVIGIAGGVHSWKKIDQAERAPLVTRPAIVTGKRAQVSGGGRNSSASTHYFATFEDESGQRDEYRLWGGTMYGRLSEGDAGVLFLRGNLAVDFDRVEM